MIRPNPQERAAAEARHRQLIPESVKNLFRLTAIAGLLIQALQPDHRSNWLLYVVVACLIAVYGVWRARSHRSNV